MTELRSSDLVSLETTTGVLVPLDSWNRLQDELRELRKVFVDSGRVTRDFPEACSTFITGALTHCRYCGFLDVEHGVPAAAPESRDG